MCVTLLQVSNVGNKCNRKASAAAVAVRIGFSLLTVPSAGWGVLYCELGIKMHSFTYSLLPCHARVLLS